jgi:NAD(P)-dependent dehydrogenase (short-subunit alcohol dehydrogenase family)
MQGMAEQKHGAARDHRPLAGRVALVTGGSRGIGRGIAVELLREGASVVIGDLADAEMEATCRELAAEGPVDWVKLDVASQDSRHAAVDQIRAKHGPISILVNNAGIASAGYFDAEDPKRIGKELAVDLIGAICLTRMVLPHMVEVGWGRITNISSMMAFTGSPGFAIYSAAKAGLLSFSEAIDRELRYLKGVHVTAVLPPSVRTQAFEEAKRSEPGMMRWNLVPPVSVEQVARRTVRGLIKGRRHVYTAVQSYFVSLLHRFLPWVLDMVLMYMFVGRTPPRAPHPGARLPAASA